MIPTSTAPEEISKSRDSLYNYTKSIIAFLQLIFSKRDEGNYKYTDDDKSEIFIGDQNSLMLERIPRIIVIRGPAKMIPLVMSNRYWRNNKNGMESRAMLIGFPMSINVIAKIGVEAQEMAFYIIKNMIANKNTLQRFGGFHKISSDINISPEMGFNAVTSPEVKSEASLIQIGISVLTPFKLHTYPTSNVKASEIITKRED
jgi:hypothetical protein